LTLLYPFFDIVRNEVAILRQENRDLSDRFLELDHRISTIERESADEVAVEFQLKANSFPSCYASIVLARAQNSIPTTSTNSWSWTFYLFGSDASPHKAGEFQVHCMHDGKWEHFTDKLQLQTGSTYDVKWKYGTKGSRLTVQDVNTGVILTSVTHWKGTLTFSDDSVIHKNKVLYSTGGRGHSLLDGTVTNVREIRGQTISH
jgi:hypothetical protein